VYQHNSRFHFFYIHFMTTTTTTTTGVFNGKLAQFVSPATRDKAAAALVAEQVIRILAQR
jgi:hypothetical protein